MAGTDQRQVRRARASSREFDPVDVRPVVGDRGASVEDPAHIATPRHDGGTAPQLGLTLKYHTPPTPDPAAVDRVIDLWRQQGWPD
jgi:hypothetical protein